MEAVSDTLHLGRRDGTYYYRRRVADFARAATGADVIRYSLRTYDKKRALKLREIEEIKWRAKFEAASTSVAEPRRSAASSSANDPVDVARDSVARMDQRPEQRTTGSSTK